MSHHDDAFSTLETVDLEHVTGGAGGDSTSMMLPMMMMMMRGRPSAAPAPAPAPPPTPKILLNGVEQQATMGPNGLSFDSEV